LLTIKRLDSTVQYIHKTKLVSSYNKRDKIIGVTYQADEILRQISAWELPPALAWVSKGNTVCVSSFCAAALVNV